MQCQLCHRDRGIISSSHELSGKHLKNQPHPSFLLKHLTMDTLEQATGMLIINEDTVGSCDIRDCQVLESVQISMAIFIFQLAFKEQTWKMLRLKSALFFFARQFRKAMRWLVRNMGIQGETFADEIFNHLGFPSKPWTCGNTWKNCASPKDSNRQTVSEKPGKLPVIVNIPLHWADADAYDDDFLWISSPTMAGIGSGHGWNVSNFSDQVWTWMDWINSNMKGLVDGYLVVSCFWLCGFDIEIQQWTGCQYKVVPNYSWTRAWSHALNSHTHHVTGFIRFTSNAVNPYHATKLDFDFTWCLLNKTFTSKSSSNHRKVDKHSCPNHRGSYIYSVLVEDWFLPCDTTISRISRTLASQAQQRCLEQRLHLLHW